MAKQHILVGVAWPYANGALHAGHLAGAYLPADIFARYQRLRGNYVLMVSGTDCHGTPVTVRADAEGVEPGVVAERYHKEYVSYWERLGITFDLYTTTMTPNHAAVVRAQFLDLWSKGVLFEQDDDAYFDEVRQQFLPDRYLTGVCPYCDYTKARGDQCENCGRLLDPEQLKQIKSVLSDSTPVLRATRHFFLDLPRFERRLLDWVATEDHWREAVRAWTKGFLKSGLKPRAITRDLTWGIPVPAAGYESKRIYVWFEAVTGYLSASMEWAQREGDESLWERWWKEPDARQYYFVGKDNIPFHTVIWPAILMARGDVQLPYDIPANEFVNFRGEKASKSSGVGLTLPDLMNRFSVDAIRFYVASILPETGDTSFDVDNLIAANNNELLATWGNLVQRTLTLIERRFGGTAPQYELSSAVYSEISQAFTDAGTSIDRVQLRAGLRRAMQLAQFANRYLNDGAPWNAPDGIAAEVLGNVLCVIENLSVLLFPYVPHSSMVLRGYLAEPDVSAIERGWLPRPFPAGRVLRHHLHLFERA